MSKMTRSALFPPARSVVRGLRFSAAAIALHGLLLWLAAEIPGVFDLAGGALFWILAVPALILARPFIGLFWKLGLMNAPGWFAWPKPLGMALAYALWVAVLLGLAQAVQWWARPK